MDILALAHMAVESMAAHRLRTFLVSLGIIIGITAVIGNAAMVEGFQNYVEKQMEQLGSNFVLIRPPGAIGFAEPIMAEEQSLDEHLFESVRRLPHVVDATAAKTTFGLIEYMGEDERVIVYGVEPGYLNVMNRKILAGQALVPQDRYNAIVSDSVMDKLIRRPTTLMSPFQLILKVDDKIVFEKFRIKGLVEDPQRIGIGMVFIPIRTLNEMLGQEGYTEISVFASDMDLIDTVEEEVTTMLDRLLHVKPERQLVQAQEEEKIFGLMPAPLEKSTREEYKITTQADLLALTEEITEIVQLVLAIIASISLIVGSIGIANVMLVTVSERTREIGVMKAVGAKNSHVLAAFLIEAGLIGVIGGMIGLAISTIATYTLVPILLGVPGSLPVMWVVMAIGISLLVSLLAGLYPALRASRMAPVEALRTE